MNQPDDQIVLIMDGARWRKSKPLRVPPGMRVMVLPP